MERHVSNQRAPEKDVYLSSSKVQDRYQRSSTTLRRWERDGALGFPKPLTVNKRKLYRLSELVAWEAALTCNKFEAA